MNNIQNYLKESGYGRFLSSEDLFPVSLEKFQNKTSQEIFDGIDFFFVIEGSMDIFFPDKNGKNHLLARVYANDYQLGGIPKYFSLKYHNLNHYIAAMSKDAAVYGIKNEVMKVLMKTPEFLDFTFEKQLFYTSDILRENYFRSIFSLEEYLAYILYKHSTDSCYTVENYSSFASLLKCDRTNLYRVIASLEDQGLIKKDGKTINIISMKDLEDVFDEKF